MSGRRARLVLAIAALLAATPAAARIQGFLRADGTRIVDGTGRPVLLRGVGLGGWMLQEGYMLELGALGQQHVIHRRLAELTDAATVRRFHTVWLDHFVTEADVRRIAALGFNSIRLPLHYALLTPPLAEEPVAGRVTWREDGFARVDRLVRWAKKAGLVVILDLHAAPGGQGTDLAIADRDPTTPSFWDAPGNRAKAVALWRELARRYADEPAVAAYDVLNEPNWDFTATDKGGHGCGERTNAPLAAFYRDVIAAIRSVDRRHLIVLEGNCWGNNYLGLPRPADGNVALSFHKYWNRNDAASLAPILALRQRWQIPVWLGETGENSDTWYTDMVRLVEAHEIGWNFWPWKKIGFNQPQEVVPNPGWRRIVAHLTAGGPRPTRAATRAAMLRLAGHDVALARNREHREVADALLRQPHNPRALPFARHAVPGTIAAVDYDLGPAGVAYHDTVTANYHVATGGERQAWNDGRTYRNDGVDIARDPDGTPFVTAFERGEWLRFTVPGIGTMIRPRLTVRAPRGATLTLAVGGTTVTLAVLPAPGWQQVNAAPLTFSTEEGPLTVAVEQGRIDLRTIALAR